jgi:hypothetical protein
VPEAAPVKPQHEFNLSRASVGELRVPEAAPVKPQHEFNMNLQLRFDSGQMYAIKLWKCSYMQLMPVSRANEPATLE